MTDFPTTLKVLHKANRCKRIEDKELLIANNTMLDVVDFISKLGPEYIMFYRDLRNKQELLQSFVDGRELDG
jgi:hypothetical protein